MKSSFLLTICTCLMLSFGACKENKNVTEPSSPNPQIESKNPEATDADLVSIQLAFKANRPHGIDFGATKEDIKKQIKDSLFREDVDTLTYTVTQGRNFWDYTFAMDPATKKYTTFYLDFYCLDSVVAMSNFKRMKDFLELNKETFGAMQLIDTTSWQGASACCKSELQWVHEENDLGYQFMFTKK